MHQRLITGKSSRTPAPRVWVASEQEQGKFQDQRQDEADDPEGAHPGVFHDGEGLFRGAAAAQAVGGVGQAVQVQPAGDPHRQRQEQGRGRRGRQHSVQARPGPPVNQAQEGPDPGEPEHGAGQGRLVRRASPGPGQLGEKGEGQGQGGVHASWSATPASPKVAISR